MNGRLWVLAGVAWLTALLPAGLGLVLGWLFLEDARGDRVVAAAQVLLSLLWLCLPALGTWLMWRGGRPGWGSLVCAGVSVLSLALTLLLAAGLEAAVRP